MFCEKKTYRMNHNKYTMPRVLLVSAYFILMACPLFARTPTNLEEVQQCMLFVQTLDSHGKPLARGTGFVVQDNGTQWIYTNAHVIEGAKRIIFTDTSGDKLSNFGHFECFSKGSGSGAHGETRFGGDGIRLELKNTRNLALALSANPKKFSKGVDVVTIGDNAGDLSMNITKGRVTAVSDKVIQSTCKTQSGCSGGALIDPDSFEVVGLHTFGIHGTIKLSDAIWQQGVDEKVAGASILKDVKWVRMNAADFLKGSEVAMQFRDTVRMLAFVYALVPQENGFKVDPSNDFAANLTFEQAFDRFDNDPILRPVINLNRKLAGRGGNIGINNMELVRIYAKALTAIRASYHKQRKVLIAALPPYYLISFEQSGFYEVGDFCFQGLGDAQKWFANKSKLGGTMPVGRWLNLKPLSEIRE